MNVIVIGSGAREHALCRLISKSYLCDQLYCFPGNYGISRIATCRNISDIEAIIEECKSIKPDLVVIGPENYLSENLAGKLREFGLNVFGPNELGARLESSKEFMKKFCKNHDIPTAKSESFNNFEDYQVTGFEDIDGFKFLLNEDNWVMIRPSGTEPVLRVYAQAENSDEVLKILDATKATILS